MNRNVVEPPTVDGDAPTNESSLWRRIGCAVVMAIPLAFATRCALRNAVDHGNGSAIIERATADLKVGQDPLEFDPFTPMFDGVEFDEIVLVGAYDYPDEVCRKLGLTRSWLAPTDSGWSDGCYVAIAVNRGAVVGHATINGLATIASAFPVGTRIPRPRTVFAKCVMMLGDYGSFVEIARSR